MSTVLCVEPINFGADPGIVDNKFIKCSAPTESQAARDNAAASRLVAELRDCIADMGVDTYLLRLRDEPDNGAGYESKGDAIFPNNSISFHNFTDSEGKIVRRVVILYPMSRFRRGELPREQLLDKLEALAVANRDVRLVDLRRYEEENRAMEGTGSINFSYDGRFAYMSRSQRTDDELFDAVCAEENLAIPRENRYVFSSAIPRADGSGEDTIYHTNVLGWVGKGICAWALDLIKFPSEAEKAAFYEHLERKYEVVINLTTDEINHYAGNAFELAASEADGSERRFVCMSETSWRNLTPKNRKTLADWYGEENILPFFASNIEERSGGSIRCTMGASITHGPAAPNLDQISTLELAGVVCAEN